MRGDCWGTWLIMLGFMDLGWPRVCRRSTSVLSILVGSIGEGTEPISTIMNKQPANGLTSEFDSCASCWHRRWHEYKIFIAPCTDRWLLGEVWSCWVCRCSTLVLLYFIVVDRDLRLMGDKMITDSAGPNLESPICQRYWSTISRCGGFL